METSLFNLLQNKIALSIKAVALPVAATAVYYQDLTIIISGA